MKDDNKKGKIIKYDETSNQEEYIDIKDKIIMYLIIIILLLIILKIVVAL